MNKKDILSKVKELIKLWQENKIPKTHNHEVHPKLNKNSRERYLYFTLPPSLNFQRQSPAMWKSALSTWNDPETNYLFFPEKVVRADYKKVQKDLLKYKLSLQLNKHTDIWISLCKSFNQDWDNDPRKLITHYESKVENIISFLRDNKKNYLGAYSIS